MTSGYVMSQLTIATLGTVVFRVFLRTTSTYCGQVNSLFWTSGDSSGVNALVLQQTFISLLFSSLIPSALLSLHSHSFFAPVISFLLSLPFSLIR